MTSGDGLGPELWRFLCPKKLRKIFIDFSLFQLFSFLKLWDLHHSEKPEFVSMNCLKDSSRDGLELEIQTSRPRKIAKRAFLVEGILVGIIFSVMSKIIISCLSLFSRFLGFSGFGTFTNTRNLNSLVWIASRIALGMVWSSRSRRRGPEKLRNELFW